MKLERFEFQNKDVPMLKKDILFRIGFMILFLGVFASQFVLFVSHYMKNTLTTLKLIVSIVLLVVSLMYALISFVYAFRSFNLIQKIALHGHAIKNITVVSTGKKNSFLKLYSIITVLISIVMLVILISAITYTVLQYIYFTNFSFYLPILFFVSFAGLNSVYHIKSEIKTIQNVREFNSIF